MATKSPVSKIHFSNATQAVASAVDRAFCADYAMVVRDFDRIMMRILCPDDHLDERDRDALACLHTVTCELRQLTTQGANNA